MESKTVAFPQGNAGAVVQGEALPDGSNSPGKRAQNANYAGRPADGLWTLEECALFLGIGPKKLRQLANENSIPHLWLESNRKGPGRVRRGLRFSPAAIRAWVASKLEESKR